MPPTGTNQREPDSFEGEEPRMNKRLKWTKEKEDWQIRSSVVFSDFGCFTPTHFFKASIESVPIEKDFAISLSKVCS